MWPCDGNTPGRDDKAVEDTAVHELRVGAPHRQQRLQSCQDASQLSAVQLLVVALTAAVQRGQ